VVAALGLDRGKIKARAAEKQTYLNIGNDEISSKDGHSF
jgi:hypothetical protein